MLRPDHSTKDFLSLVEIHTGFLRKLSLFSKTLNLKVKRLAKH